MKGGQVYNKKTAVDGLAGHPSNYMLDVHPDATGGLGPVYCGVVFSSSVISDLHLSQTFSVGLCFRKKAPF